MTIRRQLMDRRRHRTDWLSYGTELQDGARFLLISIEMPSGLDANSYRSAAEEVRKIVGDKIAMAENEPSWIGVIKADGRVVESVMPDSES